MIAYLKDLYFPSQLLTDNDFNKMCVGGKVLEQDERGVKVIQLTNGEILKIFRVKKLLSGTNLYSYARRFCRNARRLARLDIPTVTIKTLFHFEGSKNTAVLYRPLEGETLTQVINHNNFDLTLADVMGDFLADLHQKGIHFHSLHTGNVVQTSAGDLGLIDISDMSIYAWPLFCSTRVRSFKRLCKYQDDIRKLGTTFWSQFLDRYFDKSQLSQFCRDRIKRENSKLNLFK
ncbi:toluene tolerance family protein [Candidatus Nitrosopumilus salaria BD31]|uniref:Toluene tolerance family protein n=1 Tax=Candidatus Nitrosopumilus salarius BD31 TaxID=859350 RepID=I3D104_9ARCH|nr:toluene tolerance family protein [Candidatus Nitrosopumilus salaria BD31]